MKSWKQWRLIFAQFLLGLVVAFMFVFMAMILLGAILEPNGIRISDNITDFVLWISGPIGGTLLGWQAWRAITIKTRHEANTRNHLCQKCGYDLRATPERCPECG